MCVYVTQARYRIPIQRATAGNLVLVEGIDSTINKTATVITDAMEDEMHIFKYAHDTHTQGRLHAQVGEGAAGPKHTPDTHSRAL